VDVKIRKFKNSDLDQVIKVEKESFKVPYTREIFKGYFSSEIYESLVAEVDNKIVGYIIISPKRKEIISIAVRKKYRRKGIGRYLLKEGLKVFKSRNTPEIILMVRENNLPARKFYEKNGFEGVGILRQYYKSGETAIIMFKRLS
jgi:ribosomal-protein-alanine N-acetyltransferase